MTLRRNIGISGWLIASTFLPAVFGQSPTPKKPLVAYVLEVESNLKGQYSHVASELTKQVTAAFVDLTPSFKILDRRNLARVAAQNQLEADLHDISRFGSVSPRVSRLFPEADGFIHGELVDGLDGVVLTLSLTAMDSTILWQGEAKHSAYDWGNLETRQREAIRLAEAAESKLRPTGAKLRSNPKEAEERSDQALLMLDSGQPCIAIALARQAIDKDANNATAYYVYGKSATMNMAQFCGVKVSKEESQVALQKYLAMEPEGKYAKQAKQLLAGDMPESQTSNMTQSIDSRARIQSAVLSPLLTDALAAYTACGSMGRLWSSQRTQAPALRRGELDDQHALQYRDELMPKLVDIRKRLIADVGVSTNTANQLDYARVKSVRDLLTVCQDVNRLLGDYQMRALQKP